MLNFHFQHVPLYSLLCEIKHTVMSSEFSATHPELRETFVDPLHF